MALEACVLKTNTSFAIVGFTFVFHTHQQSFTSPLGTSTFHTYLLHFTAVQTPRRSFEL